MDAPRGTIVVAWDERKIYQRHPAGVLFVHFPPAPQGATDLFTLCASVAVAQAELGGGGGPSTWTGASQPFLDRVVGHFNWRCGPSSRDTYWDELVGGWHGKRQICESGLIADEPPNEVVVQDYVRQLFNRISGYVLGEPEPDSAGTYRLSTIEFRCSKASRERCDEFRALIRQLLEVEPVVARQPQPCPQTSVRNHMIDFGAFMVDRTRGFVGRRFVFDAIDRFLREASCGYFVIRGDPGIGKSALLSHLILERGLPVHHFNIATDGIVTPAEYLQNICARLATAYRLTYSEFPEGFDRDGRFFRRLLDECAAKTSQDTPLVIAIDALDEVDNSVLPPATNCLFLPAVLPPHVYMIVTTRARARLRLSTSNLESFTLESDDKRNLEDVQEFLEDALERPRIQKWIASQGRSNDEFLKEMLEKSEGNFMYLHYVLPAIERGEFDRQSLPSGLAEYYHRHWAIMQKRARERFETVYRPTLCVFAAVGEPVSIEEVAAIAGLELYLVGAVLREWIEFFQVVPTAKQARYRVYHSTFGEFLQEVADPGLKTYHRMIADHFLRQSESDAAAED